jgi:hypothetical protein
MWYNPIIKLLLLSPLHGFASRDILLLEYTGRRSGKKITVPLSYIREELDTGVVEGGENNEVDKDGESDSSNVVHEADYLILSLRRRTWWRNLKGSAPVRLRVRGKWISGVGEAIEDKEKAVHDLGLYIQQHTYLAKYFEVRIEEGKPDPEDLAREVEKRLMVRVHPNQ